MGRIFGFLLTVALVVVGLSFAVLNATPVTVQYYFGEMALPLSLVMVLALAAGVVLGIVASMTVVLKNKREMSKLKKEVDLSSKELKALRTAPMRDES